MAVWRPLLDIKQNYKNNYLFCKLYLSFEYYDGKRSGENKLGETDVNKEKNTQYRENIKGLKENTKQS